ncbi:MAG: small ribosomal subunit Rsm22 family protein [Parachlamydiaceae bacterium]
MTLPDDLKSALEQLFAHTPESSLTKASMDLSTRYRSPNRHNITDFMTSDTHRMAYLAVRLPATFAVVHQVLTESARRLPQFAPTSLCDIGAGPGTGSWAAMDLYPNIQQVVLHEKDEPWLKIGKNLMQHALHPALRTAEWKATDILQNTSFSLHDLTILSYVVGELPQPAMLSLIDRAWNATSQVIAIIEPGTPHGFERIRTIREFLIGKGAFLVAPCPHQKACPMANDDWCHFAERIERSSLHRKVKDVSMGYEDEKFSYVVASKSPVELPESRIVRHPQHHSGHVDFVLCGQTGLEKKIVSKKLGVLYKQARKLEWGDTYI